MICSAVASRLCLPATQTQSDSQLVVETSAVGAGVDACVQPSPSSTSASSSDPNEATLNESSFRERLEQSELLPAAVAASTSAGAGAGAATSAVSQSHSDSATTELHVVAEPVAVGRASTSSTLGVAEEGGEVDVVLRTSPGSTSSSSGSEGSGSGKRASVSASFSVLDSSSNGGVEQPEPELESPVPEPSDLEWPGDDTSSDTNGGGGPKRPKGMTPPGALAEAASTAAESRASPRAKPEAAANATQPKPQERVRVQS